jgi:hypothetical protein
LDAPAFAVRAGSFQCVWFFSLGKKLHQPVIDWWRRDHADTADCEIAVNARQLPQLTAVAAKNGAKKNVRGNKALEQVSSGFSYLRAICVSSQQMTSEVS